MKSAMVREEARCEVTGAYWLEITGPGCCLVTGCLRPVAGAWLRLLFSTTTVTEGHWPVLFFSSLEEDINLIKM